MLEEKNGIVVSKFINNVCKGKNEVELEEAEMNLEQYLLVVNEIAERLDYQAEEVTDFDLF